MVQIYFLEHDTLRKLWERVTCVRPEQAVHDLPNPGEPQAALVPLRHAPLNLQFGPCTL